MPIDLSTLAIETSVHGKTTAAIAVRDLVADPHYAPKDWQSAAPDNAYESSKIPVGDSDDLQRIKNLPRREQIVPGSREAELLVKVITRRYARNRTTPCECAAVLERFELPPRDCITELNLTQAWSLYEINTYGGLLGPIGVGHGKTILDLLAALAFPDCKKAVLLVPPNLVLQLIAEYEFVGQHFRMPSLIVWGEVKLPGDVTKRQYFNAPDPLAPVLHVFPYSRLSRPESTVKLQEIAPDLIIADECHKLRHADTATTARVLRYFDLVDKMRENGATVYGGGQFGIHGLRCAAWSGSMTDASLKDYGHIALMALRMGSPLPIDPETLEDWARALDPKAPKDENTTSPWSLAAPPGRLVDLDDGRGGHITEVYHRRLVETPGVVSTQSPAVAAELVIEQQTPKYSVPDCVEEALGQLRDFWQRPDGEELIDALTVARCARELACGFFYRWRFPPIHGVPQDVGTILEWLDVRKDYRKELRWFLGKREEHLDSPHLCELAAKRYHGDLIVPPCPVDHACHRCNGSGHRAPSHDDPNGGGCDACDGTGIIRGMSAAEWDQKHPQWESKFWPAWRDIKGRVVPETEAVRLDNYLARDAAEWALSNRGIVWYESNEFGEWVSQLTGELSGGATRLPKHGGGPDAGKDLGSYLKNFGDRQSAILSIKSHGTGRDGLQYKYNDQLVAQPPSSATTWEQLLGRLHRIGQKRDKVFARFYRHTPELAAHVDQALARALYVQTTLGSAQKLRTGFKVPTHNPAAPTVAGPIDLDAINAEIEGLEWDPADDETSEE